MEKPSGFESGRIRFFIPEKWRTLFGEVPVLLGKSFVRYLACSRVCIHIRTTGIDITF